MGIEEDFPNTTRFIDVYEDMEVIHEFIHDSGYTLCTWNEEQNAYVEVEDSHQDIVSRYFDIDPAKIDEEQKRLKSHLIDFLAHEMVGQLMHDMQEEEDTK